MGERSEAEQIFEAKRKSTNEAANVSMKRRRLKPGTWSDNYRSSQAPTLRRLSVAVSRRVSYLQ